VAIDLENLSAEAGAAYLSKLGVRGDMKELREAAEEYGGHALALTLLGGLLTDACGGDVRRRREIGPLEADSQAGGHAIRVMAAYERWFAAGPERAILRLMGLFDRPADGPALAALRAAPPIPGLTDALFRGEPREGRVEKAIPEPAQSETGQSGRLLKAGPKPARSETGQSEKSLKAGPEPARSARPGPTASRARETGQSGKLLFDKPKGPEPQPLGDVDFQRAVAALRRARLLARAALRRQAGDVTCARPDLDEALAIARRGGMKLHETDCHPEYARLHLALGAVEPARASLAIAKAMIREMGYGRREGEVAALEKDLGVAT
jgi:hypothetical protein